MTQLTGMKNLADRVLVMGILNVTPDSFYVGSRTIDTESAIKAGLSMIEHGADIVDIGGESSRPGAPSVSVEQELHRVLPVIEGLHDRTSTPLSIDTTKAHVANAALQAGATIVNDITAMRGDPAMERTIAEAGAAVVLMHMQGTPGTMQEEPHYTDVVSEVFDFLLQRAESAEAAGIAPDHIILDPGIGFGKSLEHNLALIRALPKLASCGYPVLVGLSRKSFLGLLLDQPSSERLEGTIAANAIAIFGGASIIRVHDVKEGRRTADVAVHLRP